MRILPERLPTAMVRQCAERDVQQWSKLAADLVPATPTQSSGNKEFEEFSKKTDTEDREAGVGQHAILEEETQRRLSACRAYKPTSSQVATVDAIKFAAALYQQQRESVSRVLLEGKALEATARATGYKYRAARQAALNEFRAKITASLTRTNSLDCNSLAIRTVETSADGSYLFEQLPEGTYCLHAELNLPAASAEWAMTIRVTPGKTTKIDLSSSNALLVLGR